MQEPDLLIIGGGPAGMAAAGAASRLGVRTLLVEQAPTLGGALAVHSRSFGALIDRLVGRRGTDLVRELGRQLDLGGAAVITSATVWAIFPDLSAAVSRGSEGRILRPRAILLATGSVDRTTPLPGWTLPGVLTGCGAHALLNLHGLLPGKRPLVVGEGLLAADVAHNLAHHGARMVGLVGSGSADGDIVATSALKGLAIHGLKAQLRLAYRVPLLREYRLVRIEGRERVQAAVLQDRRSGQRREVETDLVCLAEGLQPEVELARHAECGMGFDRGLGGFVVLRDERQRTTRQGVYVAGDATGIGGAWPAIREGRLAAVSVAEDLGAATATQAAELRRRWGARIPVQWQTQFGERRSAKQRRLLQESLQTAVSQ